MLYESRDGDGQMYALADGFTLNAPYIEEADFGGTRRQYAKFYIKYGFSKTLDGKKASKTISCVVFKPILIDLCKTLKRNDCVLVWGAKVFDKYLSDKNGKQHFSIQVSGLIHLSLLYESMRYFKEVMKYDRNITDVYKKDNKINHQSVNYAGEPDKQFDADF